MVEKTEKQIIEWAVAESGGNVPKAAALLGIHTAYIYKLIKRLGLNHLVTTRAKTKKPTRSRSRKKAKTAPAVESLDGSNP
jgi:hypothetical protein